MGSFQSMRQRRKRLKAQIKTANLFWLKVLYFVGSKTQNFNFVKYAYIHDFRHVLLVCQFCQSSVQEKTSKSPVLI